MFHHVKELQFNARIEKPDARFASILLEQFGGGNGELKAAMQYFVQAFGCRQSYPDKYDLLMDIATEEFSHLEIVGATITMLLDGLNGDLKNAADKAPMMKLMSGNGAKDDFIHQAWVNPQFAVLSAGGPTVTDSNGHPWSGAYVNANGDLTVDLRSNIGAESRAKIVYEYLMQFTDDQYVRESLSFLMTREIAHFQMFSAALSDIQPNFPPGVLQGDPRFTHVYFNMSDGPNVRGPWNQGQGPWMSGEQWVYVADPHPQVVETRGQLDTTIQGSSLTQSDVEKLNSALADARSSEVKEKTPKNGNQWSSYPQEGLKSPTRVEK